MSDRMTARLAARLASRDASGEGDWQDEAAPLRDEEDSEKRDDEADRRGTLRGAMAGAEGQGEAMEANDPPAPPAPDPNASLRDEIRHALRWRKAPLSERRAIASTAADASTVARGKPLTASRLRHTACDEPVAASRPQAASRRSHSTPALAAVRHI